MKLFFGGCSMPSLSIHVLVHLFFIIIKDQSIAEPQNDSTIPSGLPLSSGTSGSSKESNLEDDHAYPNHPVPVTPLEMPDLLNDTAARPFQPTFNGHSPLSSLESSLVDSNADMKKRVNIEEIAK